MLFKDPPGTFNIQVTKIATAGKAYPAVFLDFALPIREQVSLKILNSTGFQVRELLNKVLEPGTHSIEWDLKNDDGNMIGNGIYIIYLKSDSFEDWKAVAACMEDCDDFYDY